LFLIFLVRGDILVRIKMCFAGKDEKKGEGDANCGI